MIQGTQGRFHEDRRNRPCLCSESGTRRMLDTFKIVAYALRLKCQLTLLHLIRDAELK